MSRTRSIAVLVAIGVLAVGLSGAACEFRFSYDRIEAPLGTMGEIGVRVTKEHKNCTLPSMDDYQFTWEGIQVLGETTWEEVGPNLYEKWFQVSLSEIGDGYLKISKDCTKEGYEEAILPISVVAPADDGAWREAFDGTYPFADLQIGVVESVAGEGKVESGTLAVGELTVELPAPSSLNGEIGEVRVFYVTRSGGEVVPLLLASEERFVRFEHLVENET